MTLLQAQSALACTRALIEPFRIDRALAASDTQAPDSFGQVSAYTYRVEAERCSGGSCTASSCGDEGYLVLQFAAPAEAELGYRLVWLDGEIPRTLLRPLDRVMPLDPLTQSIAVRLSFSDVALLEGELALVAIDHAGNESAPSEPVRVTWSGCTEYFDDPYCVDGMVVVPPEADQRCTLVTAPRAGQGLSLAGAIALGGWAVASRRTTRRRRNRAD